MTTLMPQIGYDLPLSSLEDRNYPVLGEAMGSVTKRLIKARSHLADSQRCSFWYDVMEERNPSLFDEATVRVVTLESVAVRLAAEYSLCATKLEPTRLLDYEQ